MTSDFRMTRLSGARITVVEGGDCATGSLFVGTVRAVSGSQDLRSAESGRCGAGYDGAGSPDQEFIEDPAETGMAYFPATEPSSERVFGTMWEAEHCAEGAAGGDYNVCGGEV